MTDRAVTLLTVAAALMIVLFLMEVMGQQFWINVFEFWGL